MAGSASLPAAPAAVGIVVFPKVMAQNGWGLALMLIASWMISDVDRKLRNLTINIINGCCRLLQHVGKIGETCCMSMYRPLLKSPLICQFVGKVQAILCKPCNA